MKFLIDTNIIIPLEPTSNSDIEGGTFLAAKFNRLTTESDHQVCIHPISKLDLKQNTTEEHRKLRENLLNKYPELPNPPEIPPDLNDTLGPAPPNTNDWIDYHFLSALICNTVDFLVTEDRRIHRKAQRLHLQERVITLFDAVTILQNLFELPPPPPPAVRETKARTLNENDPIFNSLRMDNPGFANWLDNCKREHKHTWVIKGDDHELAAVCMIETENDALSLPGKALKICIFKVSKNYSGTRLGELLLKTVFAYAVNNDYHWIYITVFEKHSSLVDLLMDFGFKCIDKTTDLGELILVKPLKYSDDDYQGMAPLDFHITFGPYVVKFQDVPAFMVPLQPRLHKVLFPELEQQLELIQGIQPYGNAIRKAYLSNSSIRKITPGSNLLFYRLGDQKLVTVLGVVEDTMVSSSAAEIARYISKRTVYRYNEIESMCQKEVLAILFRQSRILKTPISLNELVTHGIIKHALRSIIALPEEAFPWLQQRIE